MSDAVLFIVVIVLERLLYILLIYKHLLFLYFSRDYFAVIVSFDNRVIMSCDDGNLPV